MNDEWMCDELECDTCKHRGVPVGELPCYACVDGDEFEPEERSEETMTRVESFENAVNAINKHSGPIATDAVMVTFISEIAGSLAVIADAMTEQKEGGTNERTD